VGLFAQNTKDNSSYLFDEFQDCLIVYKDGRQFTAPVNYDLIKKHYVFKDPEQQEKEFSDPELIAVLRIGNRSFLIGKQEAVEVIQAQSKFNVIYTGDTRRAPKKISYGGTTQTASVDNYSGLTGTGLSGGIQDAQRIVTGINKTYEVGVGKKTKRFYNKKSFLKLFPKKQQVRWNRYIEENKIDFGSVDQVFKLFQVSISH
jgi:hypothetical protein